jgi:hypothetical protein
MLEHLLTAGVIPWRAASRLGLGIKEIIPIIAFVNYCEMPITE